MALGREAVSKTVGGVMILCWNCSIKRDSCSSLVWLAAQSPASSLWIELTVALLMTLLATPSSLREDWWLWLKNFLVKNCLKSSQVPGLSGG